jgi:hypothetical protein
MPEIGTSGSMSGDGKRSVAARPKRPRPSSTLPSQPWQRPRRTAGHGSKADAGAQPPPTRPLSSPRRSTRAQMPGMGRAGGQGRRGARRPCSVMPFNMPETDHAAVIAMATCWKIGERNRGPPHPLISHGGDRHGHAISEAAETVRGEPPLMQPRR